ncbi:MAG: KEOPS complex subunit Pcc1 [Nitrososphaeraceae archaeon]|jgi:tRNA threonylcarbamoyladenosine modification (KEOPS) complex  Pcc1 subunit
MKENHHNCRISVNIEIEFAKVKERDAILNTLLPDNINFPDELSMEMSVNNNSLIINTSSTKIDTMINTINEILHHISLATKVIKND